MNHSTERTVSQMRCRRCCDRISVAPPCNVERLTMGGRLYADSQSDVVRSTLVYVFCFIHEPDGISAMVSRTFEARRAPHETRTGGCVKKIDQALFDSTTTSRHQQRFLDSTQRSFQFPRRKSRFRENYLSASRQAGLIRILCRKSCIQTPLEGVDVPPRLGWVRRRHRPIVEHKLQGTIRT